MLRRIVILAGGRLLGSAPWRRRSGRLFPQRADPYAATAERRRPWVPRMTLGHSRHGYKEAVWDQSSGVPAATRAGVSQLRKRPLVNPRTKDKKNGHPRLRADRGQTITHTACRVVAFHTSSLASAERSLTGARTLGLVHLLSFMSEFVRQKQERLWQRDKSQQFDSGRRLAPRSASIRFVKNRRPFIARSPSCADRRLPAVADRAQQCRLTTQRMQHPNARVAAGGGAG